MEKVSSFNNWYVLIKAKALKSFANYRIIGTYIVQIITHFSFLAKFYPQAKYISIYSDILYIYKYIILNNFNYKYLYKLYIHNKIKKSILSKTDF